MPTISQKPLLLSLLMLGVLGFAAPAQAASVRTLWMSNLRQIALAIQAYQDVYKQLPQDIRDAQGKPLLSWRVSILPFVEEWDLYSDFNLQEPWDSPHNRRFLKETPSVYQCRKYDLEPGFIMFTAPRGEETLWGPPGARRDLKRVQDGLSSTIMLIEVAPQNAFLWTKPDDLLYDPNHPLDKLNLDRSDGPRLRGGIVAFADGSVRLIPAFAGPELFRAMFSPAGGEDIEKLEAASRVRWPYPLIVIVCGTMLFSILSVIGGTWTIIRFWRGKDLTPGELLWLLLGTQQAVFLVSFVIYFGRENNPLFGTREQHHLALWFYPRLAGTVGALAALIFCWRQKEWRWLYVAALVLLSLAALEALTPRHRRYPEESLLTIAAPFVMGGLSIALALVTLNKTPYPGQPTRRVGHWLGIGVALFPLLWFCLWFFQLDWVELRLWVVRVTIRE